MFYLETNGEPVKDSKKLENNTRFSILEMSFLFWKCFRGEVRLEVKEKKEAVKIKERMMSWPEKIMLIV